MNARERLDGYLASARSRLGSAAWARFALGVAALAFAATLVAGLAFGRVAFLPGLNVALRVLLAAGTVALGFALLWRPLRALGTRDGAAVLERALPSQGGRVETYLDGVRATAATGRPSPLLDLLAEDAARVADAEPLDTVLPRRRAVVPAAFAAAAVAGLALLVSGVLSLAPGARLLWGVSPGTAALAATAAGGIDVKPGDVAVRRNQDLAVSAIVAGGASGAGRDVRLHVRFGEGEWEEAPMEADSEGRHGATLFALRDAAEYYVSAGKLESARHRVQVVDLPQVEGLKLTYQYPSWTGLKSRVQESGGDIEAVEGTRVRIEVQTDVPVDTPLLVVDEASEPLSAKGPVSEGSLTVRKAGQYRIATRFGDEVVALTEDFRIALVEDEKPTVEIRKPGRDYQASPIEEVPVAMRAEDDFRIEALELKYSVNGGDWRTEKLPAGTRDIQAAALLRLEELQQPGPGGAAPALVPGDLVSYYGLARDRRNSAQTDLFLIQVQPFDRRYTQSQAGGGGGGGGGGDDENKISERQREILLATYKLTRDAAGPGRDAERQADNARMLSDLQKTLADQANTLVERAKARLLTGADPQVKSFVESLEQAAGAMAPAIDRLAKQDLQKAISDEQRALQHLLRAEATFRDIQVAMNNSQGGGGGGSQAGRDVSEMTELEMDLEKNQYETESKMSAQAQSETESDVMKRLRELARRQEQLAREASRQQQAPENQRWRQEQLRREAEELRRQLEQLAQNQQGGARQQQGQQGQQGAQQQGNQQGNQQGSPQGGQQTAGQPRGGSQSAATEALEQLRQAIRDMERGADPKARDRESPAGGQPGAAQDPRQVAQAGERLNRAAERLEQGRKQAVGESFEQLSAQASELVREQRRSEQELRAALDRTRQRPPDGIARNNAASPGIDYDTAERLAAEKRELQSKLEGLQREMQAARRRAGGGSAGEPAAQAAERVAKAAQELDEAQTSARLARSALELERGRTLQAASRDGLITESLEQLESGLGEAARTAGRAGAGDSGGRKEAGTSDLLAELAELRRAWDDANSRPGQRGGQPGREPATAGQPGAGVPGREPGQQAGEGQQSGQGQQQGEGQQSGQSPGGQQSGGQQAGDRQAGGSRAGGGRVAGGPGGGAWNGGAIGSGNRDGGFLEGDRGRTSRGDPQRLADRGDVAPLERAAADRLQALRGRLPTGSLPDSDIRALDELASRLRRGAGDPMSTEYRRMVALVNQLELAALRASPGAEKDRSTRADASGADPSRYRDDVAEYYRRLGDRPRPAP